MINIQYVDSEEYVQLAQGESYVISPSPILVLRYVSPRNSPALLEEEGSTSFLVECRQDVTFSNNLPVTITSLNEPGTLSIRRRTPDGLQDGGTSVALAADAVSIRGVPVAATAPGDSDVLVYSESEHNYSPEPQSGGGGGGTDAESIRGDTVVAPTTQPVLSSTALFPLVYNYTAGEWEVSSQFSASQIEFGPQTSEGGIRFAYLSGRNGSEGDNAVNLRLEAGSADPGETTSGLGGYIDIGAGSIIAGAPSGGNVKIGSGDSNGVTAEEGAFIELTGATSEGAGFIILQAGASEVATNGRIQLLSATESFSLSGAPENGITIQGEWEWMRTGTPGVDEVISFPANITIGASFLEEGDLANPPMYIGGAMLYQDGQGAEPAVITMYPSNAGQGGLISMTGGVGLTAHEQSPASIAIAGAGTGGGFDGPGSVTVRAGGATGAYDSGVLSLRVGGSDLFYMYIDSAGVPHMSFFEAMPNPRPVVSGSRGGNAALASLITGLAALGLIIDDTTA